MKRKYGRIGLKKLRVKKRSKDIQRFIPEKIQEAIIKAGGETKLAAQTTRDAVNHILHNSQNQVVTFKNVAETVIKELKRKDKQLAKTFEDNMKKKTSG